MNFKPSIFVFLLCLVFATVNVSAQTIVSGNVSGTWNIGGSPYLLIDDCTVQTGTELIIEPGVEIVIGDSISLNVYGKISANGTSSQHIIFRAPNNNVKFDRVYVLNGSSAPPVSEFKYCEFMNAQTGLYLHAYGRINNAYTTMQTNVSNCSFDSSVSTALYVRAQAVDASTYMSPKRRHARVNPSIDGCTFNGNQVGIEMDIKGAGSAWFSNGDTKAIIQNNTFLNLPEAAISMLNKSLNSGSPSFVNNTIVNCNRGVWIQDEDFNATTINNIFYGTATAIERTGSNTNSLTAYYNCFYGNAINFVGYPATYGDIVWTNANGDSCDLGFNIFQDPLFANPLFHLSDSSSCNSAGIDSIQNNTLWYHAPDHDIGGDPRPMPAGTMPDMGAWEMDYPVGIGSDPVVSISASYELVQNYPNPFNPSTIIRYRLPKAGVVSLIIYNMIGQEVKKLINENQPAGEYQIQWDGRNEEGLRVSSGLYLYRMRVGSFIETRRMIFVK